MADVAYRAMRALLYISGAYVYNLQDDKAHQARGHGSFLKLGIEEFDAEESELEKKIS